MEKKTTLNCCVGVGCHAGCFHTTHVVDGKIHKVVNSSYPNGEKGVICIKGIAGARLPYHPDRLKHPLKRVGARGEGKWKRITWEQALDEIAEKLKIIRQRFQPESVLLMPHYSSAPGASTQMLLGHRLKNLLKATSALYGISVDSNPNFSGYFTYGLAVAQFMDPKILVQGKTKYMIVWGCNPKEKSNRFWKFIRQARKSGAKLVDIGLMKDATAESADQFIQVAAGSDGALALSMVHVIIEQGLFDDAFVSRHTNGPFLVREDNGKLLRHSDLSPDGAPENFVVWDVVQETAQPIAPYTEVPGEIRPALTGTYEPAGIKCTPAFQMLADLARAYAPGIASGITGVSSETIEKLAVEYATTKPAAILLTFGLRYENSGNAIRVMDVLSAITGNVGVMGGGTLMGGSTWGYGNAPLLNLNDKAIRFATDAREKVIPQSRIFQCLTTGHPYPIKAMLTYGWNFMNTHPHPKRWIQDIFPNLELLVVNDIFMTASAEYADYVLPDCTVFERDDMDLAPDGHIVWQDRAIDPLHDCRPPIYYWSELAKRLELGKYFDKTIEEWSTLRLASEDPSVTGIDPPLTFERLKKEKTIRANVPEEVFNPLMARQFMTPSGKLEFYNEALLSAGDALPVFREQRESPRSVQVKRYPLVFNTANPKNFVHTLFANDPVMLEKYMKEPHLHINPLDAESRDISDEDYVVVFNDRGSCTVKALTSDMVPAGVVHIPHGWWPRQFVDGHPQHLIESSSSLDAPDKAREIQWEDALKRWDPHAHYYQFSMSFSADKLFDCLCEIKKAT